MTEQQKLEYINHIRGLVAIESVCDFSCPDPEFPYGKGPDAALNYTLDLCEEMGFRTKRCGKHVAWAEVGEGSPLIGVLCHLDIVPLGEGWTKQQGEVADGCLYGRGVIDDKGPVISTIYAMKRLADNGELKGRVRLILGQCEETGNWIDMNWYKEHEELPDYGFTPDADFPLIYAEKGITNLHFTADAPAFVSKLSGGTASNVVPSSADIEMTVNGEVFTLHKDGKPAHASRPHLGINAISLLMNELPEVEGFAFADFYKKHIGLRTDAEGFGYTYADEVGPLTMNAGKLYLEGGKIHLITDIRYPVTGKLEDVVAAARAAAESFGITVESVMHLAPVYIPQDSALVKALMEAYVEGTGDTEHQPIAIGGGTYARAMPNVVAFGSLRPGRPGVEHQADERQTLEDLYTNVEVFYLAIKKLMALPR